MRPTTQHADDATGDFRLDRRVRIPALTFLAEGDEVTVGRAGTSSYVVLPSDGAEVLHRLAEGMTPAEAGRWYETTYGEELDILELLRDLAELDLLPTPGSPAADGHDAYVEVDDATAGPVRWQRLGLAVFHPVALAAYALLLAAAVTVAVAQPDLRPHYSQLLFTDYLTVVALVLALGQWPLILVHEAAHALAGRRLGLDSRLRISYRLYYLVFETTLDGLVTVPRRKRWLPMLAGIGADVCLMAVLTLAAAALRGPDGTLGFGPRLLLAVSFGTLIRIIWQFYFYLRTDMYYLVSLVLGTRDLHGAATRRLANTLARVLRRPDRLTDDSDLHPVDRRAARWYVWLIVLGYSFTIGTLLFVIVPATVTFLTEAFGELGGRAGVANAVDSAVIILLCLGQLLVLAVVIGRQHRRR